MDDVFTRLQRLDDLDAAVMQQESGGRANAVSPKGASGPMQVMPATAANPGLGVPPFDPTDPAASAEGGRQYFAALLGRYNGDVPKALAAYNGGMGRVDRGGALPAETQNYVKSIMGRTGAAQPQAPAAAPASDVFARLDALPQTAEAPTAAAPDRTIGGYLSNVATSGGQFAGHVAEAFAHPLDTMNAIGKTAAGAIEHLAPNTVHAIRSAAANVIPESWTDKTDTSPTPFQVASGAGDYAKKRYGSWDAVKNTLYTDPVGSLADAATVLAPVGRAVTGAGELSNLSRVAQVGRVISKAGEMTDPVNIAAKGIGQIVQPAANSIAEHIANVNLQVPKAMRRREMGRAGGVPHAEAVLNTGRGTNPFTRFSQGGLDNADNIGNKQSAIKAALRDADEAAGNTYDPSPIDKAMEAQRPYWSNDPTEGPTNSALIDRKRENFRNNDKYAQDKIQQVPVQQTVQTPHPFAVDAQGNPILQSSTQTVMEPQVVGREFKPVGANQLEAAKGPIYTRQKENYGPGRDAVGSAVDKAAASAADNILDTNIPGYDKASRMQQQAEVARQALTDAILARQTKRKGFIAEAAGFAAPILAFEGHPVAGLGLGALAGYNNVVKHPWLGSPIASALWGAGHMSAPPGMGLVTPATQVNTAVKDVGVVRNVTKDEAVAQLKAHLARTLGQQE